MKYKLLSVALLSLSTNVMASDIDVDLKSHVQGQVIHRGQWANIGSHHCVHVRNNTDDKKWFKYYMRLCVEAASCKDTSKEFTVERHADWGDSCEDLNVQKQFNGIGFREIVATTNISGDKNQTSESHATLRIDP